MGKTSLIKVDIHCYIDEFEELERELLKNPLIEKVWLDRVVYRRYKDNNQQNIS